MKPWLLAGGLALAAVAGGALLWHLTHGEPIEIARGGDEARGARVRKSPEPAGSGSASDDAAAPAAAAAGAETPATDDLAPARAAEPVPLVDVHGWFIVARATVTDPALERGHVVLASAAGSPARFRVKATVENGTFDVKLPQNAIAQVVELALGDSPTIFESQRFDLSKSRWLEVHAAWASPTVLRVVDPRGRELAGLVVQDAAGDPLPPERLTSVDGKEARFDSPLHLVPRFDEQRGWNWSELLRIGAPGYGVEEIEVVHGAAEPTVVELRPAAKLAVKLAPWPTKEPPRFMVIVKPLEPRHRGDPSVVLPIERGRIIARQFRPLSGSLVPAPGQRTLFPDENGEVLLDDLPPGKWRVTVESPGPSKGRQIIRDGTDVELRSGAAMRVELDISRDEAAAARLTVRAHDARSGERIPLDEAQLSVNAVESTDPMKPRAEDRGTFDGAAGTVEISLRIVTADRAWLPIHQALDLAPGDNEIDLALERSTAVRVTWRGSETAHVKFDDENALRPLDLLRLRVAGTSEPLLVLSADRPRADSFVWFVPAGRYELFAMLSDKTITTLDVGAEKLVDVELRESDFADAGVILER